jgi:hypothetical protein
MRYKIDILKLKPTQIAIGMEEVREKILRLKSMKKKSLKKFLKEHEVPVVISPHGGHYIIDHHHAIWALWDFGIKKVEVRVVKDFSKSKYSFNKFWKLMGKSKWSHLYDQFGEGPHGPLYLPDDIRGMADDPYRSLAWAALKMGAFKKSEEMYSEFAWAQFLRNKKLLHREGKRGFISALKLAIKLCRQRRRPPTFR